ncbi:MAG: hydroxyisourate hydrolase [Micromonosporaceae bacterium]|nr:hydroxyisourate hydrolase [Micromonosporaceae bacterium]
MGVLMTVLVEVVDCMFGKPAAGVSVCLLQQVGDAWQQVATVVTDENGLAACRPAQPRRGRYRAAVSLDAYFTGLGVEPFQSLLEVTFRVFQAAEQVRLLVMVTPSSCCVYGAPTAAASRYEAAS